MIMSFAWVKVVVLIDFLEDCVIFYLGLTNTLLRYWDECLRATEVAILTFVFLHHFSFDKRPIVLVNNIKFNEFEHLPYLSL